MAGDKSFWDPLAMMQDSPMSSVEKQIRDRFITEYLKDQDLYFAAIRTGFVAEVAIEKGQELFKDVYVQRELAKLRVARSEGDAKTDLKAKQAKVEAVLWELALDKFQKGSVRVSAAAKLANVLDMDGATKIKSEITHKGGVMLVPGIAKVEDWEKEASASQDKLIAESSEDRASKTAH